MNEVIFIAFTLFLISLNLVAFRLGKTYMFILIAIYSVIMNIFVTKQFTLFGLEVTGGNALYGAIFLLTDLLSEHFSKKDALRSVAAGFLSVLVFVVATQVLLAFTPNEYDFAQESITTLFSVTPRILIGSLIAYAIAQTIDVYLYDKIRKFTKEKYIFLRNNGSTLVSQLIDSIIFTAVGLTTFTSLGLEGIIDASIFWQVTLATYAIKVVVALIDTPFIYLSYKIKK
jgi:hypothetical protein